MLYKLTFPLLCLLSYWTNNDKKLSQVSSNYPLWMAQWISFLQSLGSSLSCDLTTGSYKQSFLLINEPSERFLCPTFSLSPSLSLSFSLFLCLCLSLFLAPDPSLIHPFAVCVLHLTSISLSVSFFLFLSPEIVPIPSRQVTRLDWLQLITTTLAQLKVHQLIGYPIICWPCCTVKICTLKMFELDRSLGNRKSELNCYCCFCFSCFFSINFLSVFPNFYVCVGVCVGVCIFLPWDLLPPTWSNLIWPLFHACCLHRS